MSRLSDRGAYREKKRRRSKEEDGDMDSSAVTGCSNAEEEEPSKLQKVKTEVAENFSPAVEDEPQPFEERSLSDKPFKSKETKRENRETLPDKPLKSKETKRKNRENGLPLASEVAFSPIAADKSAGENDKKKKKKKKKKAKRSEEGEENISMVSEVNVVGAATDDQEDAEGEAEIETKKKEKKKKMRMLEEDCLPAENRTAQEKSYSNLDVTNSLDGLGAEKKTKKQEEKESRIHKASDGLVDMDTGKKKKKSKRERIGNTSGESLVDSQRTENADNSTESQGISGPIVPVEQLRKEKKKVTFQDNNLGSNQRIEQLGKGTMVEIDSFQGAENEIWGTRFTKQEDEIIKDAVWKYIAEKGWSKEEGLDIILNCSKHKEARNCWLDIQACLPHRPRKAVRYRAHSLLEEGTHLGRWSREDEEALRRLEKDNGRNWKKISAIVGRNRAAVKEKWRTLKRQRGSGKWTQDDLQQLSDLVHKSLRLRAQEKLLQKKKEKEDRHILKRDINWETIADQIGIHGHGSCCAKWYYELTSSLVESGEWADEDDHLLLKGLLESGANTEDEVEWDHLLEHRSGQICLTRWMQMVKHLGENRTKQFGEKLDLLARRYAPYLLEDGQTNVDVVKEGSS